MTTTTSVPSATSNNNSKPATNNITSATSNTNSTNVSIDSNGNSSINCSSDETKSMPQTTATAATTTTTATAATTTATVTLSPAIVTLSAAASTIISPTTTTTAAVSHTDCLTTPPISHRAVTITPILNPALSLSNQQNFSRTMQTDEDFNIRFVNLVRLHKCLYDKKVPEYRNRDNQEKAWLQISIETKESVIHCKERWRNLRACLSRYIKQQTGNDPQHKPYYLTEHMAFLLPFLKSTRNSLDGNNSLAALFQFSQQQQQQTQLQQQNNSISTTLQIMAQPHIKFNEPTQLDVKHSLSDNEDEETIDAFDPTVSASIHMHHHQHHPQRNSSPPLSDTASANTMQNFIPDVQLSEMRTPDNVVQDIAYVNTHLRRDSNAGQQQHQHHNHSHEHHHHEFVGHEPKRIKTECHASEATTTGQMHMYAGEHADMEFFRSILPDIAELTPHQKRKLKIGILELIDDVVERYPLERSTNTNVTSQNANANAKTRRNSSRDWRK